MNEIENFKEYVLKNNLLGQYRRLGLTYMDTEIFRGILTEEVLEKFKGYRVTREDLWFNDILSLEVKPIKSTRFLITIENKQPLNSKVRYFECVVPDVADAIRMFERYHNQIWLYKNYEIYANDLEHFVMSMPKGMNHKPTRAERNRKYTKIYGVENPKIIKAVMKTEEDRRLAKIYKDLMKN